MRFVLEKKLARIGLAASRPRLALVFVLALSAAFSAVPAATGQGGNTASQRNYSAGFGQGEWDAADWLLVKSPRWDYIGGWIQRGDHIENITPEDAPKDRVLPRPHGYVSMVLKEPFRVEKKLEISSRMEFSFNQGPQIVIAWKPGESAEGYPEYREHFEIVLFEQGINVWHHLFVDGAPQWRLVAYSRFPLRAKTPYDLKVTVTSPRSRAGLVSAGKTLEVSVDGEHVFGSYLPDMPEELYVGIIGYGSINRFYNFAVNGQ